MLKALKGILAILMVSFLIVSAAGCTANQASEQPVEANEIEVEEIVEEEEVADDRGYHRPESLVTADELNSMENAIIVDFRDAKLPGGYIPGAIQINRGQQFAEIEGVANMLPEKEVIENLLGSAGISNNDTVVIYDAENGLWAARLWWTMKVYGHEDVRILEGGADAWKNAGFNTEMSADSLEATTYTAKDANESMIADLDMITESIDKENLVVIDTRSEDEWNDGRVPGAVWIEWTNALNSDGTFKNADELRSIYESNGITKDKEAIMPHCKSAVRSAHTMFVLTELLGYENVRNYDGSWIEYEKSGCPIEI
ncbi:thiosulfate/3-mercaptopyruvate sulfurtransferase [Acetoanaerobium pronyense]|uniref:Sulfurtransferase n=1 Tax=Acetoanaerobium pronyense TaxID=1482736 RepID=A0ABS4KMN3_9FIRM|nr:sulfurtransferase [Acetoanaerobium pronyense]MBP2029035.1 thiosulfate/3-mercaptopyruvate sulfurtransferase [Acetoanaerobium pronyense]